MARTISAVIAGFVSWLIIWVAVEFALSAIWPEYGAHQRAFQAAIENGTPFTAATTPLLIQLILASLVSMLSGFLAASIARDNTRAPRILGILLVCFGVLKVVLSWEHVPIWHHVILLALLYPMTMMGARMKTVRARQS